MQRKLFCTAVILVICLGAMAQFKTGMRTVGASIATVSGGTGNADVTAPLSTGYTTKSNNFNIGISPSFGWFIKDNMLLGITFNIGVGHVKTQDQARDTTFRQNVSNQSTYGLGGFLRYYFKSSNPTTRPFAQFNLNAGSGSNKSDGFVYSSDIGGSYRDDYTSKSSGLFFANAGLVFGATRMLSSHVGLDIFGGYAFSYNKSTTKSTTKRDYTTGTDVTFEFEPTNKFKGHNFTAGIGFQIFLDPKK